MVILKVGALVEFCPGKKDNLCSKKEDQWLAAIVCFVFEGQQDKGRVNLRVFDENGNGYARMRVAVVQPKEEVASGDGLAEAGYCRLISCPPIRVVEVSAADAATAKSAEKKAPEKNKP